MKMFLLEKLKMEFGFLTVGGSHGKNYWCDKGANMMNRRQIIIRQYDENINISSIGEL